MIKHFCNRYHEILKWNPSVAVIWNLPGFHFVPHKLLIWILLLGGGNTIWFSCCRMKIGYFKSYLNNWNMQFWYPREHLLITCVLFSCHFILRSVFSVNKLSCFNFCNYYTNEKVIGCYMAYKSGSYFPSLCPVYGIDGNIDVRYAGPLYTHFWLSEWWCIHCSQCVKQLYLLFPLMYICQKKKFPVFG